MVVEMSRVFSSSDDVFIYDCVDLFLILSGTGH